jgi:hypothetical protein
MGVPIETGFGPMRSRFGGVGVPIGSLAEPGRPDESGRGICLESWGWVVVDGPGFGFIWLQLKAGLSG